MKGYKIVKSIENTLIKQRKLYEYNWILFTLVNTALALAISLFFPLAIKDFTKADCFITTFLSCVISTVGLNQYTIDVDKLDKIGASKKNPHVTESRKRIVKIHSQIKLACWIIKLGRVLLISTYGIMIGIIALEKANLIQYNSAHSFHSLILINYCTAIFFNLYIAVSLQIDREYKILSWYKKAVMNN